MRIFIKKLLGSLKFVLFLTFPTIVPFLYVKKLVQDKNFNPKTLKGIVNLLLEPGKMSLLYPVLQTHLLNSYIKKLLVSFIGKEWVDFICNPQAGFKVNERDKLLVYFLAQPLK